MSVRTFFFPSFSRVLSDHRSTFNSVHLFLLRSPLRTSPASAQQDELEAIKIKTMYQMVEDIQISDRGRQVSKKLLFLTTKQAASFNANNIQSVVQALELRESHFIIRLMPSYGGKAGNLAHKERKGMLVEMLNKPPEL